MVLVVHVIPGWVTTQHGEMAKLSVNMKKMDNTLSLATSFSQNYKILLEQFSPHMSYSLSKNMCIPQYHAKLSKS